MQRTLGFDSGTHILWLFENEDILTWNYKNIDLKHEMKEI